MCVCPSKPCSQVDHFQYTLLIPQIPHSDPAHESLIQRFKIRSFNQQLYLNCMGIPTNSFLHIIGLLAYQHINKKTISFMSLELRNVVRGLKSIVYGKHRLSQWSYTALFLLFLSCVMQFFLFHEHNLPSSATAPKLTAKKICGSIMWNKT